MRIGRHPVRMLMKSFESGLALGGTKAFCELSAQRKARHVHVKVKDTNLSPIEVDNYDMVGRGIKGPGASQVLLPVPCHSDSCVLMHKRYNWDCLHSCEPSSAAWMLSCDITTFVFILWVWWDSLHLAQRIEVWNI